MEPLSLLPNENKRPHQTVHSHVHANLLCINLEYLDALTPLNTY